MKKKIYTSFAILSMSMLVASSAFAAAQSLTPSSSPSSSTINDPTGGSGATIVLKLSPNVNMSYNSTAAQFELASVNTKGTMEYGVWSGDSSVYQKVKTPANGAISVDTMGTTDGSTVTTWHQMGGGSSSGS